MNNVVLGLMLSLLFSNVVFDSSLRPTAKQSRPRRENAEFKAPPTKFDKLNQKIADMLPIQRDISFIIVDLKFDGEQIKVCEFGEGPRSCFNGYDKLFGAGAVWKSLWKSLRQHAIPKWYVENNVAHKSTAELKATAGLDDFLSEQDNLLFSSIEDFQQSPLVAEKRRDLETKEKNIFNASGLVIVRHLDASTHFVEALRNANPDLMILDSAVGPFVNDKSATDILFQDEELQSFRPRSLLCKKFYTAALAPTILEKMPARMYVIKPLNAFKGDGVIMVAAEDLDETLRYIFTQQRTIPRESLKVVNGHAFTDKTYSYWRTDKAAYFIVEELCHSKAIELDGKSYDPTMRVVCMLSYLSGEININYLAAYWKLPL